MQEPTVGRWALNVAGFFVSLAGFLWFVSTPYRPPEILPRLGFLAAGFCAAGALIFFWAASFAYLARNRKWSPRSCIWAGLLFAVPGACLSIAGAFIDSTSPRFLSVGGLLFLMLFPTGNICRRLAYPELTDEQAYAPGPPPSLFPR